MQDKKGSLLTSWVPQHTLLPSLPSLSPSPLCLSLSGLFDDDFSGLWS